MWKRIILVALALLLAAPTAVYAAAPETVSPLSYKATPSLSFEGTVAICTATVHGSSSDSISVVMRLWQGNACIATWSASGTGSLELTKSKTVTSGVLYKLTVDATVNGVALSTVTAEGSC